MANVTININARDYNVACGEGQEEEIRVLASYINEKGKALAGLGHIGEHLHLVMTSLLLADEINDLRNDIQDVREGASGNSQVLEDAMDELAVAQEELANYESEIKNFQSALEVATKENDSLRSQIDASKDQMRELAEKNIDLENECKQSKTKQDSMLDALSLCSVKVDRITEKVAKLQ